MDWTAWFEKLFASEATQQLILNAVLAVGAWVALKVSAIVHNFKEKLEAEKKLAEAQGKEIQFSQTKAKFLDLLSMGVVSAEETYKREVLEKYEGDHKLTKEEGEEIWKAVYKDAWNQMQKQDQELLEAFMGDIQSFAKSAIHANLTKLKAIKVSK